MQIGEHKYGKPILDRVTQSRTCGSARPQNSSSCLSIPQSRSNLSVGMPIDMLLYNKDTFSTDRQVRIDQDDPYFQKLSHGWSEKLRAAFGEIDEFDV